MTTFLLQLIGGKTFCVVITLAHSYERKKNIMLALQAFHELQQENENNILLVIAGGYDVRVAENVQYYEVISDM